MATYNGASFRNRAGMAFVVLAVSALAFLWAYLLDGSFFSPKERPISAAFLVLAIVSVSCGVFLIVGGRFASHAIVVIGLSQRPVKEANASGRPTVGQRHITNLLTILQVLPIWTLTLGWICFVDQPTHEDTPVSTALGCLLFWGIAPAVLAPFCSRHKIWALAAAFGIFTVSALSVILPTIWVLLHKPSMGAAVEWHKTTLFYLALCLAVAYTAGVSLFLELRQHKNRTREFTVP